MVNSKLAKCCPGCGFNDDRAKIFAKKPYKKLADRSQFALEEPIKIESISTHRKLSASKPDIFNMLEMLHELETGKSGRKSAGTFFMNQPGMPLLKTAWPRIDAKMQGKEKEIATACKLSDEDLFFDSK